MNLFIYVYVCIYMQQNGALDNQRARGLVTSCTRTSKFFSIFYHYFNSTVSVGQCQLHSCCSVNGYDTTNGSHTCTNKK
jgi:hypothetical protein